MASGLSIDWQSTTIWQQPPRRGYRYDLLQFISCHTALNNSAPDLPRLTEHDLITWRQHMLTQDGQKAASINRRLAAVRRLL